MASNREELTYHPDNALSNKAEKTEVKLDLLGFWRLQPLSPNLAPMELTFSPAGQNHLRVKKITT